LELTHLTVKNGWVKSHYLLRLNSRFGYDQKFHEGCAQLTKLGAARCLSV